MKPSLPLSERLDLFLAFLSIGLAIPLTLLSATFRGSNGAETFGRAVSNALIRKVTARLSVAQLQYISGTSTDVYNAWAKSQSLAPVTEILPGGGKIHWIGDKKSPKIIYHIHGGGYILPLSAGHPKLLNYFRNAVKAKTDLTIGIAILEYTMAPHASYPTQMRQAAAGLLCLLDEGIAPSDIILSGDSAGAHIGLCVVAHLLHNHPQPCPRPTLTSPLAGFLLISPRVSNDTTAPSFSENKDRDILNSTTLARWIDAFKSNSILSEPGGVQRDGFWTEPRKAPLDWWRNLRTVIPKAFISAGQHECFRDDILALAESWTHCDGVEIVCILEEKGIHDSPLMDIGAGRRPTRLTVAIVEWLVSVVNQAG